VVVKIFTCILMITLFIACGRPESQIATKDRNIVGSTINSDSHALINESGFNKCSEEFAPISSSFNGYFNIHHHNSSFLSGQINHYVDLNSFTQDLKDLVFTKDEPCKQIQIAFSGDFANNTSLRLKISKPDAGRELIKFFKVKDFAPSYLAITNDFLPDNMSRLPDHHFEVNVLCPSGMTVFCPPEEGNCNAGKHLNAKFPDEPCTIKGTDQVFALYPSGQVHINFEGTITKIRTIEDYQFDEVDIKFTNIKWR
jgi:hypothetical protein